MSSSENDGDGAADLCEIIETGGIPIARKLDTAMRPDMPESAIERGSIDFVILPEENRVKNSPSCACCFKGRVRESA